MFYDGYDFIRRSAGLGNRNNPWSEKELSIPGNMGLYDNSDANGKFLLIDYDPHVSTNKITKIVADNW